MSFFNPEAAKLGLDIVKLNDEVRRIERLPRRSMVDIAESLADELTELLRRDGGSMRLRPIQAVSLYELGEIGGLFGLLRVGAGKTLISMLAPVVSFAERPLLLIPASLKQKTERDFALLSRHWEEPPYIRIMSYEMLGRAQSAETLEKYEPDQIIADEAHRLKNRQAACTRRVRRYMNAHPETIFVAMSGTMTKRSLLDYAHILKWCLPPVDAPLPRWYADLELWADALDERKGQIRRADPGALRVFCNDAELEMWDSDVRTAARRGFRRRLIDTPGIVATQETPIDASLILTSVEPKVDACVEASFETLRRSFKTPDEWPIADGLAMFRHARELALGFYYVWNPRPPKWWLVARTEWCAYVRKVLKHSKRLDTEKQVRDWVRQAAPDDGIEVLEDWLEVRDEFKPNTEPRWISDCVVKFCADWARKNNGIVWVEHTCFGERLAELSGLPFYGRKGLDRNKRFIEDHPHGKPMIASIASNSTGRNLQHGWHKSLISSMPPNGLQNEQLLGRVHRDLQKADEVFFDVVVTCPEHVGAFWQAVRDCHFVHDTTGSPQKMLDANINMLEPEDIVFRSGSRWAKTL